jgi:hypothetical protein
VPVVLCIVRLTSSLGEEEDKILTPVLLLEDLNDQLELEMSSFAKVNVLSLK